MKLYEVEFNTDCYKQVKDNKELKGIKFKWEKESNYPGHVYSPKTDE